MKKFLITSLLGMFLFAMASVNAATIQRDVGINTELKVSFVDYIGNDNSAATPVNFCQRTELLSFCEAAPLIRGEVFTELICPKAGGDGFYSSDCSAYNRKIPIIDTGGFSRINSSYFI